MPAVLISILLMHPHSALGDAFHEEEQKSSNSKPNGPLVNEEKKLEATRASCMCGLADKAISIACDDRNNSWDLS